MQGHAVVRPRARWSAAASLVAFACLGLPARAGAPGVAAEPPKAASSKPIRFGLAPWQRGEDADDIRHRYLPLLDYLTRRLGVKVELVAAKSYSDTIDYLASGRVQFATIGPLALASAQRQNHGVRLLLVEQSWTPDRAGKVDSYRGLVLALKSRADLRTLADVKGRAFGFVARESTSGFAYPNAMLRAAGIEYATDLSSYVFLGSHPRLTDALAAGSIDAGATWGFNLDEARRKHGDIFKILHEEQIPGLALATHPSLGEERRKLLREALLAAPSALFEGLPTAGFVDRPESFYDGVRRLLPDDPE